VAVEARLTKQMPWVGTPTQRAAVESASAAAKISRAEVVRQALDKIFGLSNGELPPGQTLEDVVETGLDALRSR